MRLGGGVSAFINALMVTNLTMTHHESFIDRQRSGTWAVGATEERGPAKETGHPTINPQTNQISIYEWVDAKTYF